MNGSVWRPNSGTMNSTRWTINPDKNWTCRDKRSGLQMDDRRLARLAAFRAGESPLAIGRYISRANV